MNTQAITLHKNTAYGALENKSSAVFNSFQMPKDSIAFGQAREEEKGKYKFPVKKVVIAVALISLFIEFNLRRNPRRKYEAEQYARIFARSLSAESRDFPSISSRDEVIVKEAAKGSKKALEMLPKVENGDGIAKFVKVKQKLENHRKNFLEGRYDHINESPEKSRKFFLKNLKKLQRSYDELYAKYIAPMPGKKN